MNQVLAFLSQVSLFIAFSLGMAFEHRSLASVEPSSVNSDESNTLTHSEDQNSLDSPLNRSVLAGFEEVAGEYVGEIRLQDTQGKLNRLVVENAKISIQIKNDQLVLKDELSHGSLTCSGSTGGIRELITHPIAGNQQLLLKAWFDVNSKGCKKLIPHSAQSLIVFVARDQNGSLVLETLHTHGTIDLNTNYNLLNKINVHGIFNKQQNTLASQS